MAKWEESKHPRDGEGKFSEHRQNTKYGELTDNVAMQNLLSDEFIPRSVGAKARNYDIRYGKEIVHLVEGTYIQNKEVIAGKHCKRDIDEIDRLVKNYGGEKAKWQKVKGYGYVEREGKGEMVEIHWYEEPSVGKVKMKVKVK